MEVDSNIEIKQKGQGRYTLPFCFLIFPFPSPLAGEGRVRGADNMNTSKIIYSINIEDVQNVAEEKLGRKLAEKELEIIEDKIGDYIDWYSAIDTAMQNEILH
jgi:hypothetical protein